MLEKETRTALEIANRFDLTPRGVVAILKDESWRSLDDDEKRVTLILVGVEEAARDECDPNELRRRWLRRNVV